MVRDSSVLGASPYEAALLTLDPVTGDELEQWVLSGIPARVVWSADRQEAAVAYVEGASSDVALVDADGTVRDLDLGAEVVAEVHWGPDGDLWVMADLGGFNNSLVRVDPDTLGVIQTWEIPINDFLSVFAVQGDRLYTNDYCVDLVEVDERGDPVVHWSTGAGFVVPPNKTAIRPDGFLYSDANGDSLLEYDPITGEVLTAYPHGEENGYFPIDYGYFPDGDRVWVMVPSIDMHLVRIYDRDTGELLQQAPASAPPDEMGVLYDKELMLLSPDLTETWAITWDSDLFDVEVSNLTRTPILPGGAQ